MRSTSELDMPATGHPRRSEIKVPQTLILRQVAYISGATLLKSSLIQVLQVVLEKACYKGNLIVCFF